MKETTNKQFQCKIGHGFTVCECIDRMLTFHILPKAFEEKKNTMKFREKEGKKIKLH